MKKILVSLVLGIILIVGIVVPAQAAPGDVTWEIGQGDQGLVIFNVNLNMNSLQVNYYQIVNNGSRTCKITIYEIGTDGEWVNPPLFQMSAAPYTTTQQSVSGFKYYRTPATDHDDPSSLRTPKGVNVVCG